MRSEEMSRHGGNLQKISQESSCEQSEIIDFSASINPLGPPEYFRSVLSRNISAILHYPDPDCTALTAAAAERYGIDSSELIIANGTSELIYALPRILPVQRAVIPVPSYVDYANAAGLAGLEVVRVLLHEENGFQISWPELSRHLSGGELVFLGQPNNPVGLTFDNDKLLAMAARFPDSIFVVDEAFADFVEGYEPLFGRSLPDNVVVIKSLTKFYAIPGLRLGLAAASAPMAAKIRAQLSPWSVNSLALSLGEKIITDLAYFEQSKTEVSALRRQFVEMLQAEVCGLKIFESQANFLLIKVEQAGLDGQKLRSLLLEKGLAIRVCDNFIGLGVSYFRLAVRRKEENRRLAAELGNIMGRPSAPMGSRRSQRHKRCPSLMFQGAGSDVGKSILTAGLCRVLLQDGIRVAPFKSQNMSLNSFVTRDGGEMGRAQVVQAQACRLDPDIRMNPVLLKPSSDVGSQIIVNGCSVGNMVVEEYLAYKPTAFKAAQKAYDSLAQEYDTIILEGAGSPAEVNLKSHDIVNMNMARYAESPVLLIGDIDRGGVFASLIGTMDLLTERERQLVAGFVINRFRGRESLLDDALSYTKGHTGKSFFGVVPFLRDLGLPEEDSVGFKDGLFRQEKPAGGHIDLALIDLPHISNFTDFEPFLAEPDVWLRTVSSVQELGSPDLIIVPGSKNVMHDMDFLRTSGLAAAINVLADGGGCEIIGICGGFQMLGERISDPHGIEGKGEAKALGLLELQTVLAQKKTLRRQDFRHLASGMMVRGYEIHHGQSPSRLEVVLEAEDGARCGAAAPGGMIWGTYLHGLFDSDPFRHWLLEKLRARKGLARLSTPRPIYDLEPAFDRLADTVRQHLDMARIYRLLGL